MYSYNGYGGMNYKPSPAHLYIDRWGKPGQKYLLIKSLQHNFWSDWALSPVPETVELRQDENHTQTGLYASCVINFDSSTDPAAAPSTTAQEK